MCHLFLFAVAGTQDSNPIPVITSCVTLDMLLSVEQGPEEEGASAWAASGGMLL